jgi:hypothetical protein
MGSLLGKAPVVRLASIALLALLSMLLAVVPGKPAAAASLVGKDGQIHACYKAKGKAKGTLRVVRGAKARCPRGWKKAAWNAAGSPGAAGENGAGGGDGQPGAQGGTGATGTTALSSKVSSLESQVSELLTKVKSLEGILAGINNEQLLKAIAAVPVVGELCGQTKKLNEQTTALGTTLSGLSTIVDTLTILGLPAVPTALLPFTCAPF